MNVPKPSTEIIIIFILCTVYYCTPLSRGSQMVRHCSKLVYYTSTYITQCLRLGHRYHFWGVGGGGGWGHGVGVEG